MDKTAIKNFSIWARNKLIADITYKAGLLGVAEEGIKDALPQSTQDAEFYDIGTKEPYVIHGEEIKQRKELVAAIKRKASQLGYKDAYRNVVEEVAYTWFNRLIAIRFMEVNDYMPAHIRVLSSDSKNKLEPDLVTTPFDAELEFTQAETDKIMQMKTDNQVDALFRFLFIKQCNALNAYLPKLFEKTFDYTELLLNVSVTDQDGIVYHLTHDMNEDDFNISNIGEDGKPTGQVEIIGWMYQYYNTEPKDEAFALLKKNVKITKERIPAATQLFTPDWIVRYMVENSVGRLWLEGHEDSNLKNEWKYYLDEAEQEADVTEQLRAIREEYKNIKPEEIKVIDPCMGSGHILVYAFDVLMQIYESYGYSQRDAAKSIVENNIYGLDIDDRAFQLAYFAIMMKARSYNRRFLALEIEPNLCAIQESNGLQYDQDMGDFLLSEEHRETLKYLLHIFVDAKEYGSVLNVEIRDYDGFLEAWKLIAEASLENVVMMLWYNECDQIVPELAKQANLLSSQYDCVMTNPPYMGNGGMEKRLSDYIRKYYEEGKSDLYAVFIKKCLALTAENRYTAMITQQSWMFLSSFKKMRELVYENDMVNMLHLGARAFDEILGEVVQTASYVMVKRSISGYKGTYERLIDASGEKQKEDSFFAKDNQYVAATDDFKDLPDMQIAYWVGSHTLKLLASDDVVGNYGKTLNGLSTSDNERFLRLWFEVDYSRIKFDYDSCESTLDGEYKWMPHNKGGSFIRWYGNRDYLVNWECDGKEIKEAVVNNPTDPNTTSWSRRIFNWNYFFKPGITWSDVATGKLACRVVPQGVIFNATGPTFFVEKKSEESYFLAYFNSKVFQSFLDLVCPGLHYNTGAISKLPVRFCNEVLIGQLVDENVSLVKKYWDARETSWEFDKNPVVRLYETEKVSLAELVEKYIGKVCDDRAKLKENEERLNQIFIDLYELGDKITPKVDDEDISIIVPDTSKVVRDIISYAIGCVFGRYSLDENGLRMAGVGWQHLDTEKYDKDNIILISDEEYLEEDIVSSVSRWIEEAFESEHYTENITFIANHLSVKGTTYKEKIRYYFMNDFFKEHLGTYSVTGSGKRPIYWLFDSGKHNGFKALIYMHRYNVDTIGNLRVDYLHRMERIYESEINRMQDTIDNSSNAREVTAATKRKEKLQKQLKECQEYDEKIGHLALSRIDINLDDGVKVNYEKVQTAKDGKKYQVLAKI